ncbi:MAG: LptF/LptG family permease [Solimonas sp.]
MSSTTNSNVGAERIPENPNLATRQLLRRHATAFAVSFVLLTALLLAKSATRQLPEWRARGDPPSAIVEVLLLSLPSIVALTIPMSVFVAVLWVFTRLGAEGALTAARQERRVGRRLVAPVLGFAAVLAVLSFVCNAVILPRTNHRLVVVLAANRGQPTSRCESDRCMTIGKLRAEARRARTNAGPDALAQAAIYEVEVQKKYSIAAACVILALLGVALALVSPRGGVRLVFVASFNVFIVYYVSLVAGESLADRLVISPFVAMWLANAFCLLLAAALGASRLMIPYDKKA